MSPETIGALSGCIIIISAVPYTIGTWKKDIHPQLTSWLLWTFIGLCLLLSYKDTGATHNIWPVLFGFTNPLVITLLVFKNGGRITSLSWLEKGCLAFGICTFLLWWYAQGSPVISAYAVYLGIIADAFAAIPTIVFVWKFPQSDRPFAWSMFSIGYGLTWFTIPEWTTAQIALPLYMTLGGLFISIPLVYYRLKHKIAWKEWL